MLVEAIVRRSCGKRVSGFGMMILKLEVLV